MTASQGDLASLSRFIFRAPSWYSSLAFALAVAALAGIAAFDSRFILEDAWEGIFYIGIPTVVASAVTPYVDRVLGGNLTPNRASLLALVCELLLVGALVAASVLAVFVDGEFGVSKGKPVVDAGLGCDALDRPILRDVHAVAGEIEAPLFRLREFPITGLGFVCFPVREARICDRPGLLKYGFRRIAG